MYDTAAQGVGRLAEAYTMAGTNKDYVRVHKYDILGRASTVTQQIGIGGTSYVATPVYDIWSRLAGQTYKRGADAEKVFGLRYNDKGHLASVVRDTLTLWTVSEQDAANRPTKLSFGNATTQTLVYYPSSGRMQSAQVVGASQNQLLQERYGYDAIGSVLQRTQAWNGPGFIEDFHYDELGRLDSSKIGLVEKLTTYYADGSIKSKSGVGGADYRYPAQGAGSSLPHAVEGFGAAPVSFTYDLNGNLKTGMGRVLKWTTFVMPSSITKGASTVSFVYGPEHQRTRQDRGADGTVYAGAQEVETNGGEVKVKT